MKTFAIKADAEFEADDIDDAFRRLSIHFQMLEAGKDSALIEQGTIVVAPIEDQK